MFKTGFQDESIAYALAAGLVSLGSSHEIDRDYERTQRRMRRDRRRHGMGAR